MRILFISITAVLFAASGCDRSGVTSPPTGEEGEVAPCTDGVAGGRYTCLNIDLLANITPQQLQGEALNDIWGWTDPETGTEYALVGLTDGVSFVDLSDPVNPVVVGKLVESELPGKKTDFDGDGAAPRGVLHDEDEGKTTWRDVKVYQNYLLVVSDAQPHGMQVFNLEKLRDVTNPPALFGHDVLYEAFGNAHNIAVNEATGFAYATGSNTFGGGLHIVDITTPLDPVFSGFHSDSAYGYNGTGYVHDTQCVIYIGPDSDYQGDEICFNSGETHLVIANVTVKEATYTISGRSYPNSRYIHQGWLSEDHRYFLSDDELDEANNSHPTRTYIWDLTDLDDPQLTGFYEADLSTIDHNQYIKGEHVFQANYTAGLRILDISGIGSGALQEVAFFDTYPDDNATKFDGAWSNYPYFESGIVVVSDISNGLFVLRPNLD